MSLATIKSGEHDETKPVLDLKAGQPLKCNEVIILIKLFLKYFLLENHLVRNSVKHSTICVHTLNTVSVVCVYFEIRLTNVDIAITKLCLMECLTCILTLWQYLI